MTTASRARRGGHGDVALRVVAAALLGVSGYVHLHLAHLYRGLGDTITQADLFYAQGAVAIAVALWLLVTGMRLAWWSAAAVGAASFAAVMLYRYVDVGAIGPLPNMNDASWQPAPDKLLSAVVEAAVVGVWLVREAVAGPRRTVRDRDPAPADAESRVAGS
jgi:hypothetical protein